MIQVQDSGNGIFVIKIVVPEVHTIDILNLKEKLKQAIIGKDIKKLVIDLSDVKMITSTGIGIFLNINNDLHSNLRLTVLNDEVRKVLDLTKVSSVIKVFKSNDDAIKSF